MSHQYIDDSDSASHYVHKGNLAVLCDVKRHHAVRLRINNFVAYDQHIHRLRAGCLQNLRPGRLKWRIHHTPQGVSDVAQMAITRFRSRNPCVTW